jgi:hypothetical protein
MTFYETPVTAILIQSGELGQLFGFLPEGRRAYPAFNNSPMPNDRNGFAKMLERLWEEEWAAF